MPHTQFLRAMLQNFFAPSHQTADVGADLDVKLSARLRRQHRVVADHVSNFELGQVEPSRQRRDYLVRQKPNLILRIKQRRHQGRPLRRIVRHHLREPCFELIRKFHLRSGAISAPLNLLVRFDLTGLFPFHQIGHPRVPLYLCPLEQVFHPLRFAFGMVDIGERTNYRSISPNTISILPIAATTSAINPPSHIFGSVCKFARHAALICTRYGFAVPSLTM